MQLLPRNNNRHTPYPGRFDQIRKDLEVVEQEIGLMAALSLYAAHLRYSQHHPRGLEFSEPGSTAVQSSKLSSDRLAERNWWRQELFMARWPAT